jgi:L-fuculose-phosphate aldolase
MTAERQERPMSDDIRYQKPPRRPRPKTEPQLREEVIGVCGMLWQKGFVSATDGNVSVRLDRDRFLCTPSGFSKGLLRAEQLVVVGWDAEPVGPRYGAAAELLPSSEMLTHLEAYRRRPDIGAVVHAHPPVAVALSIAGISLARCLLPEVVLAYGLIPTARYATPSSTQGAEAIREHIERYDAMVLERHGSLTVGESAVDAYLKLEKLEATAAITRTLATLGQTRQRDLPPEEVARLVSWRERQGLVRPGQSEDLCAACGLCPTDKPPA